MHFEAGSFFLSPFLCESGGTQTTGCQLLVPLEVNDTVGRSSWSREFWKKVLVSSQLLVERFGVTVAFQRLSNWCRGERSRYYSHCSNIRILIKSHLLLSGKLTFSTWPWGCQLSLGLFHPGYWNCLVGLRLNLDVAFDLSLSLSYPKQVTLGLCTIWSARGKGDFGQEGLVCKLHFRFPRAVYWADFPLISA